MEYSKLLISEDPLIVLPSLAQRIGLEEAIVLQQIHYWVTTQEKSRNERCFKHGFYWVYNTIEEWQSTQFKWWSPRSVQRFLLTLERMGLILSHQFEGQSTWNQRKWYTINYAGLRKLEAMEPIGWEMTREKRTSVVGTLTTDEVADMRRAIAESTDFPHHAKLASSIAPNWNDEYKEQRLLPKKSCQSAEPLGGSAVGEEPNPYQPHLTRISKTIQLNPVLTSLIQSHPVEVVDKAVKALEKAVRKGKTLSNPTGYFHNILGAIAQNPVSPTTQGKPLTPAQIARAAKMCAQEREKRIEGASWDAGKAFYPVRIESRDGGVFEGVLEYVYKDEDWCEIGWREYKKWNGVTILGEHRSTGLNGAQLYKGQHPSDICFDWT